MRTAFVGTTAGGGVGASASLAGDVNDAGSFGVGQADAYAGGVRKEVIQTVSIKLYSMNTIHIQCQSNAVRVVAGVIGPVR